MTIALWINLFLSFEIFMYFMYISALRVCLHNRRGIRSHNRWVLGIELMTSWLRLRAASALNH